MVWLVFWTRPGRRFLRAVLGSAAVRRCLWTAAGRQRVVWPMLDDARIRAAAVTALDHNALRSAVVVAVRQHADRAAWPGGVRLFAAALRHPASRADLCEALERGDVRRDMRIAATGQGVRRAVAVTRIVITATSVTIRNRRLS